MTITRDHLLNSAISFMRKNHAQYLSDKKSILVSFCMAHLQELFHITAALAERISTHALAEVEDGKAGYIDIQSTTDHAVVYRDSESGSAYVFTAALLKKLASTHALPITHF